MDFKKMSLAAIVFGTFFMHPVALVKGAEVLESCYTISIRNDLDQSSTQVPGGSFTLTAQELRYFGNVWDIKEEDGYGHGIAMEATVIAPEIMTILLNAVRAKHTHNWGLMYDIISNTGARSQRKSLCRYGILYEQAELLGFGYYDKETQKVEHKDFLKDLSLRIQGLLNHYVTDLAKLPERQQDTIWERLKQFYVIRAAIPKITLPKKLKPGHKVAVLRLLSKLNG